MVPTQAIRNKELTIQYRMIRKDEFDRLKKMFPDDEETWKKYRAECMHRLANREMDIFVIETGTGIIGEVTYTIFEGRRLVMCWCVAGWRKGYEFNI
ncbi:MAG: hypothetical protein NC124_11640 [Clostridium sp.]|nr:hypothetical protein [Clostridium sp.]